MCALAASAEGNITAATDLATIAIGFFTIPAMGVYQCAPSMGIISGTVGGLTTIIQGVMSMFNASKNAIAQIVLGVAIFETFTQLSIIVSMEVEAMM